MIDHFVSIHYFRNQCERFDDLTHILNILKIDDSEMRKSLTIQSQEIAVSGHKHPFLPPRKIQMRLISRAA